MPAKATMDGGCSQVEAVKAGAATPADVPQDRSDASEPATKAEAHREPVPTNFKAPCEGPRIEFGAVCSLFQCAITQQFYTDPVVTSNGNTYDLPSLVKYWNSQPGTKALDPMTRMESSKLVRVNWEKRQSITDFIPQVSLVPRNPGEVFVIDKSLKDGYAAVAVNNGTYDPDTAKMLREIIRPGTLRYAPSPDDRHQNQTANLSQTGPVLSIPIQPARTGSLQNGEGLGHIHQQITSHVSRAIRENDIIDQQIRDQQSRVALNQGAQTGRAVPNVAIDGAALAPNEPSESGGPTLVDVYKTPGGIVRFRVGDRVRIRVPFRAAYAFCRDEEGTLKKIVKPGPRSRGVAWAFFVELADPRYQDLVVKVNTPGPSQGQEAYHAEFAEDHLVLCSVNGVVNLTRGQLIGAEGGGTAAAESARMAARASHRRAQEVEAAATSGRRRRT